LANASRTDPPRYAGVDRLTRFHPTSSSVAETARIHPGRFRLRRLPITEKIPMRIDELIERFLAFCSRHRAPATCGFYRTRLRMFRQTHGGRDFATLSPLDIDEFMALADAGMSDIDRTTNAIVLREHKTARKTGKPRRIPIGQKLGALLTQAIGERQAGPIFLSSAGKSWTVPNLSRTYSRLRDDAGLSPDLVLYLARHECGTKVCREKGIEFARRLLGHSNISTTQRYMHLDDRELADAQDLVE
jgi:integrase